MLAVAPDEAAVFDVQVTAFRANPVQNTGRDDPLGSDFGAVSDLVTSGALLLGRKVAEKAAERTVGTAVDEADRLWRRWLRKSARPRGANASASTDFVALHAEVVRWAGDLGWTPEDQARAADAAVSVVARLPLPADQNKARQP